MAILDGGVNFDARRESGIPRTMPFTKAAGDTNLIKKGVPLVKAAGSTNVTLPTVSGVNSTADKLIGFGVADDRLASTSTGTGLAQSGLNSMFPQFVGENQPGTNLEQILVHVADGITEFQLALDPAQTPTVALIGTAIGLKQQPNGQWTLDTSYTTHAPCLITKIDPDQFVPGGFVVFHVPAANSQYRSGN